MGYILIAITIFVADFFIKKWVDKKRKLGEVTPILKNRILLRKYYNKGAALDALERFPKVVRFLSGTILVLLCGMFGILLRKKENNGLKLGLSLLIGGGAGNLYDRMTRGYVVDYFSFKSRFSGLQRIVFNLSDLFIFLGTLIVVIIKALCSSEEE